MHVCFGGEKEVSEVQSIREGEREIERQTEDQAIPCRSTNSLKDDDYKIQQSFLSKSSYFSRRVCVLFVTMLMLKDFSRCLKPSSWNRTHAHSHTQCRLRLQPQTLVATLAEKQSAASQEFAVAPGHVAKGSVRDVGGLCQLWVTLPLRLPLPLAVPLSRLV